VRTNKALSYETHPNLPAQPCGCAAICLAHASVTVPNAAFYWDKDAAASQACSSYFFKMFFPNENFVPTTTRTLLRPPFNMFEKKS
jgi:hypothetical protein